MRRAKARQLITQASTFRQLAIDAAGQHRNRSQRPELVFVADGGQHRARRSQQLVPVGLGVAAAIQVELVGLVDQLEDARLVARAEIEGQRQR